MEGFRKRVEVKRKDEVQLVTDFDLRSEELVRELLAEQTPGVPIVGEEHGGSGDALGLTWYVDPIDGTNNFIAGSPIFAISLGVRLEGVPIAGAVVAPAMGLRWGGYAGGGAQRNGEPCRVSSTDTLGDSILTTGYPSRSGGVSPASFVATASAFRDLRRCGSAAVELCWVGDGTFQVYWSPTLPYWDTTAGAAIVLAAGGVWRNGERGSGLPWDLATTPALEAKMAALLDAVPPEAPQSRQRQVG